MRNGKRLLALNLALLFVIVLLPLQALAAELVPGTAYSYNKTAETEHEKMTFTAPEDGFYQLTVTCAEHPGYATIDTDASSAPMTLYKQNVAWSSDELFYAQKGRTQTFWVDKLPRWEAFYGHPYEDDGNWSYLVEQVEAYPLSLGIAHQMEGRVCIFTPDQAGLYWAGYVDEGYWGTVYQLPEMNQIGYFNPSDPFTRQLEANVTYAFVASTNYSGNFLVKEMPRSGTFGENNGLTWEVTEDGVLKIDGDDDFGYLYFAPWSVFRDEIRTIEIGKGVKSVQCIGQLNGVTEIRLAEGNESLCLIDGALYTGDESTLLCVPNTNEFVLPEQTNYISNFAFSSCPDLAILTIHSGVESIEGEAFSGTNHLSDIYFLGSVSQWNNLSQYFWMPCNPTVHFPNAEHDDVFYYERNPEDNSYTLVGTVQDRLDDPVVIPAAFNDVPVKTIGKSAFNGTYGYSIVDIPEGVETIQSGAFEYKPFIKLGLPASLQQVEYGAFCGDYDLEDIYYGGTEEQWAELINRIDDNNDSLLSATVHFESDCPSELEPEQYLHFWVADGAAHITGQRQALPRSFAIPAEYQGVPVTTIESFAMYADDVDTTLIIPETVTTICPCAFYNFSAYVVDEANPNFKSVDGVIYSKDGKTLVSYPGHMEGEFVIPDGVTAIAPAAIRSPICMTNLVIPDSVTTFGDENWEAIIWPDNLQNVQIGSGMTDLKGVFERAGLRNLESITVSDQNPAYTVMNGDLYTKDGKTLELHPALAADAIVTPKDVTTLGEYAYANTSAPTVRIGSDVTTLAYGVFYGAKNLKSLSIPDNVKSLDASVLHSCENVKQAALPEGLEKVPSAFFYTAPLESLYVPASVNEFGTNALDAMWSTNAESRLTIYFGGTEAQWKAITAVQQRFDPETGEVLIDTVLASDLLKNVKVVFEHAHTLDAGTADPDHPGQAYRTCSECGKIVYEQVQEHTHQTEVKNAKSATCTEPGYTGDTVCKTCGETIERGKTIPALGHAWSEWAESRAATETTEGVRSRMCARCGDIETRTIPKLDPKSDPKPEPEPDPIPPVDFKDVPDDAYYATPVAWAVDRQITDGTSETTFSPEETCTRGQIVTFLWRAAEKPEPTKTDNPFSDVSESDYFYKAVLWAVEKGITDGTSETTFSPNDGCTRGQVVTFMHRANDLPEVKNANNPFADVLSSAYYFKAVLWAVEQAITDGTSETTFSPDATCTRGQIVTFLYRGMA